MRIQRVLLAGTLAAMASVAGMARAQTLTLYDGSAIASSETASLAFGNVNPVPQGPTATESYANGFTTVGETISAAAPTNASIYAGYSNYSAAATLVNPAFPTLNSVTGFTLNFTVQNVADPINYSATHPRSVLSVILLDSNHTGIEIGIRPDQVFAQASDFNSAVAFPTPVGASMTNYSLRILGGTYTLTGGVTGGMTLLTGATKQYTSTSDPLGSVYSLNNFVFLGDDTTSDGGTYNLKALSITAAATPEPGALPLSALGAVSMAFVAGRRAKARRRRGSTVISR